MNPEDHLCRQCESGMLEVHVRPNARKNFVELKGPNILLHIKAPAENGKANLETIKYVTKLTGKKIRIARGKTGRTKLLQIS
jgi:uncharacterized protein (TIGR00251 family)